MAQARSPVVAPPARQASVERVTRETKIRGAVNLDGTGVYDVSTGIGFLDHMLEQLSRHSLVDLTLRAEGDLHIDFHHTTEDTGYVVGEAVSKALGDRRGIARWGDRSGSRPSRSRPASRFTSRTSTARTITTSSNPATRAWRAACARRSRSIRAAPMPCLPPRERWAPRN